MLTNVWLPWKLHMGVMPLGGDALGGGGMP